MESETVNARSAIAIPNERWNYIIKEIDSTLSDSEIYQSEVSTEFNEEFIEAKLANKVKFLKNYSTEF